MPKKFNPTYRLTVFTNEATIVVQYPITIKFNVTKGLFSESNSATIELYNLAPTTRKQIFQDAYTLDPKKQKYIHLEAGYGDDEVLPLVFKGRILTAYSFKSGGQTDVITQINATEFDIYNTHTAHTFEAGTTFKEAFKRIAADAPYLKIANIGTLEGVFQTPTTFVGSVYDQLQKLTGGNTFIDNGNLNCIMGNEVVDVPVPVITDSNSLLETPRRRDANLDVKMLFEPTLIMGQLLEIHSGVFPDFDGQYKVIGYSHDCMISATQAGQRITNVNLLIGPLLESSDNVLTGSATQSKYNPNNESATGGAASTNGLIAVEGENKGEVNPNIIVNWIMPVNGNITSNYGYRNDPKTNERTFHGGWDLRVPIGTPVKAITDGKIYYAGSNDPKGYGTYIVIDHGKVNGTIVTSEYGHLSSILVRQGQQVRQGQVIGLSGNTGKSTGAHLHLTLREGAYKGKSVIPSKYIK